MVNNEDKADIKAKMGAKIANRAVKASDDSHPDWATAKKQPKDWKGDSKSDWKKYKQSRPEPIKPKTPAEKGERAVMHENEESKSKEKKEAMAKKIPIKAGDPKMPWHNFTAKKELSGAKAIIDKYKGRDLDK